MSTKYVYLYTDPSRNEPIYVGIGQGPRAWKHLLRKDKHPLTHRLKFMEKNGVKPIITFICENVDHELAKLVECEVISKFGRKDQKRGPLLNLTDGGDGCHNPSQETRKRMSATCTGRKQSPETIEKRVAQLRGIPRPQHVIDAIRESKLGVKRSPETIEKVAATKRGKKLSPEHKAKISAALKRKNNGNE